MQPNRQIESENVAKARRKVTEHRARVAAMPPANVGRDEHRVLDLLAQNEQLAGLVQVLRQGPDGGD